MCDLVNSDFHRHGKDTVKALKLKILKKSNPGRQLLALTALEMCMKNCGVQFHVMVINKELLHEMCRLAQKGDQSGSADRDVTDKILVLIREWAENLRLPQYQERYQDLRRRGVLFPADASRSASAAGVGADSGNTSGSSAAPCGGGWRSIPWSSTTPTTSTPSCSRPSEPWATGKHTRALTYARRVGAARKPRSPRGLPAAQPPSWG